MAVTVTQTALAYPNDADNTQRRTKYFGTWTLSGSYVAGGFVPVFPTQINTLTPATPVKVDVWVQTPATSSPLWYLFQYNYTTGKVQILVTGTASGAGFQELAAGALPTALTGAGASLGWSAEWQAE